MPEETAPPPAGSTLFEKIDEFEQRINALESVVNTVAPIPAVETWEQRLAAIEGVIGAFRPGAVETTAPKD